MCWCTYDKDIAKPKVAEQPVRVFKIVRKNNKGQYIPFFFNRYGIVYKQGESYRLEKPISCCYDDNSLYPMYDDGYREIHHGFHSYNYERMFIKMEAIDTWDIRGLKKKELVYYISSDICSHYDKYDTCGEYFVMHCTVPTGTTYYENEFGCIVSESIKVDSFEPLKGELLCVG